MGELASLVMSDIVDSTRRWNAAEGAMAADLELHDRLIREVVEGTGGSVFKHTGDGMIAVFDDPAAAAGAAAAIQQTIGSAQWQHPDGFRVRAAVHTGVVYPRDGDLFGTAVNKVARLLGVCPPGAVLVSGATTALLTDRAPEGLALRAIGQVGLAGFATPDDAHCLDGAGLVTVDRVATATDAVEASAARGGVLPAVEAELVGRGDEVASIWDALTRSPLVTLVGVGGMGKTRLALEIAAGAVAAYDGTVWWIDLANATAADAVVPVAMAAVGARETPGRTSVQSLCDRFAGVNGLVVVDNCEHVHAAARAMMSEVVNTCAQLRVVCTSREALGLRREHIVPIGALPADDGVALFNERALAVRPDLDTATDSDVIQRICARLDGIPLAIELAAARCRSMTPAEIDTRLGDRFRLLRGGRDGAERHRTLQAAVAWSYSLLDPDERAVFDQMATFAGGTLIDGLVAVTGFDEFDLLDIIDRLVARSMVVATRTPLGTRYHQLETLRQYAEDRLVEAGTIIDTRNRHLDWVRALAGRLFDARGLDAEAAAFTRFNAEVDNLRVAVAHALDSGRPDDAYEVVALVSSFALFSPMHEVLDWVRPFPADHGWTPLSAECAAAGLSADVTRGLHFQRAATVDDVPEWYLVAPDRARAHFVLRHLTSGGDVGIAHELLEAMNPTGDRDRMMIGTARLMASFFRQMVAPSNPPDTDVLVELAARTTELVRATGLAAAESYAAVSASYALAWQRPDLATSYARTALDLGGRLGARAICELADGALALALSSSSTTASLAVLRGQVAVALSENRLHSAGSMAWSASPAMARLDPELMVRFWAVWRRATGVSALHLLQQADLTLPDDLAALGREVADVQLADCIAAVLALLDRVIAESGEA